MNILEAIDATKQGHRVARAGWNGKGMWIAWSPGHEGLSALNFWSQANREFAISRGGSAPVAPCLTFKDAAGIINMGWTPTFADLMAQDWMTV